MYYKVIDFFELYNFIQTLSSLGFIIKAMILYLHYAEKGKTGTEFRVPVSDTNIRAFIG
jgi:hypothetical protein